MNIKFYLALPVFVLATFFTFHSAQSFTANSDLTKALDAARVKNYTEAMTFLKAELGKDSSNLNLYFMLANFYHLSKTESSGSAFFKRAIEKNPLEAGNYAGLALLSLSMEDDVSVLSNSQAALERGGTAYRILETFVEAGVLLNKNDALSKTLHSFQKSPTNSELYDLGYTLWRIKLKNYKRARETVEGFLEKNAPHGYAYKLAGDIERLAGNSRKAISYYLQADKYLAPPDDKIRSEIYFELGATFKNVSPDSAELFYTKSVDLSKEALHVRQFVENVNGLAAFYRETNNYPGLLSTLTQSPEMILENVTDSESLDFVYNLAEAYSNSGDILKAFEVFSEALEMASNQKNTEMQAKIFYAMGEYYQRFGQIEEALDCFEKSREAAEKEKLAEFEYMSIFEIGKIHALTGDRDLSKQNFSKVLRYAQRRGQLDLIEESYMRLAQVYLQQPEDFRSVRYYLNMADAMARQTFQLHYAANHRWVQGLVALYEDDVETAETYFLHSIKIGAESGSYLSRLAGKAGLIKVYLHTKFNDTACSYADSALTFLKNYYSYCFSEYSADFFDLKNDLIMPALMAYSSVGDLEKIYDTIELYKAIIHYKELSQVKYKMQNETTTTLQKEFDEITVEIYDKWRDLWNISRNTGEYLDTAFRIKNEIQILHTKQRDYLENVLKTNPEYYPFFKPTPKPLTTLQRQLKKENSTFVHYFIGNAATFIIVITENSINCQRVNVNSTFLESHIFLVSKLFSTEKNTFSVLSNSDVSQFNVDKAGQLYKFLIQPIEPFLNSGKTLIISKDGALNRLPFEALVTNSDQLIDEFDFSNASFLVEKYAISYLPSAYFMGLSKRKNHDNKKLFGLFASTENLTVQQNGNGNSRRGDRVSKVSKAQGFQKFTESWGEGESTIYLNKFASRENFINQGHQFQFLQVNLPGFLSEQFPFLSRFKFADQSSDYFSAYELFCNPLNLDMFLLTDAEIQLTKAGYQIAVNGFFHGLAFAGVPSLVTTLWRQNQANNNSVPEILSMFESNLLLGMDKAKALQQAKIEYLQTSRVNPIFWASLVLYGDTNRVDVKEAQTRWVIWFATIAVLTLCLFLGIQLRKVFREK